MFPAAKASNDVNQYGHVILQEIQMWVFLGSWFGSSYQKGGWPVWRGCDTRTQDGLVSRAVCWSGTVISQMSWDISCYIDSSCIIQEGAFGPQIALIMNYLKAICRKYINIARQLMQWEIDTMCSKDVRSYICIWITNTFATWGYLGNLLEEMTSIITHECFYDHYVYQIIFAVWSRETPSSAANTCIFIY